MLPRFSFKMLLSGFSIFGSAFVAGAIFLSVPAISGEGDLGEDDTAGPKVIGLWYDESKRGAVEITTCDDKLCGHVVWLVEPLNKDGKPKWDKFNSDSKKKNRPLCGMQVIGDLASQPDGTWDNGWVYDPKIGSTFSVATNMIDDNTLHVRGYLGIKLAGKSLTWTRAPDDLERCGQ